MLFPLANVGALQFRLLLIRPDSSLDHSLVVTHRCDTLIGEGNTSIEERRPGRGAPLLDQQCYLKMASAQFDDWRKGLAALGNLPVGIPLWVDALPRSRWDERIYDPEQVVSFDPVTGAFAIYTFANLPATPPYPLIAPLLIGRWDSRPAAKAGTPGYAEVDLTISEASPPNCRIGIHAYGSAWDFLPDWSDPPKDSSDYGLELIRLSSAREPATDRADAAARWTQEAGFTFTSRLQIRQALTWFAAKRGAWQSWSPLPAWCQPGMATAGTPDDYVARFSDDSLALKFLTPSVAQAQIGFIQEISTPTRSQALPGEAYLARLRYEADPDNPELIAAWDLPVVTSLGTFQPKQIEFEEITKDLKPQNIKLDFTLAYEAGALLDDWQKARLYKPVHVTLWRVDPDAPAIDASIWEGWLDTVTPAANKLQAQASLDRLLNAQIPPWVYSRQCNVAVFSVDCGLAEATYRSAGTIAPGDLSSDGLTVTVHGVTGWGGPAYADNWFGPNGILRTGTGRGYMAATILSSALAGGNLVVKLSRPFWPDKLATAGQAVQLVPACDLQKSTCQGKFDNYAPAGGRGFRGYPFIPDYIESASATTGSKK